MPALARARTELQTYPALLRRVRQTIAKGKERAFDAVERERVRTAWETGKLIHEHILLNKDRANYGQQVLKKLSKDLGVSQTELYYMVEFAKTYPIFQLTGKLPLSAIQALLAVNDTEQRNSLITRASKEKWSQNQIRNEIKKLKNLPASELKQSLSEIQPGKTSTYRISKNDAGELYLDLGFSNYLKLSVKDAKRFKEGDIVQANVGARLPRPKKGEETSPLKKISNATPHDLYTYTARTLEVLDGDTVRMEIELGFGFTSVHALRLRCLDAPEIITRDGQRAKTALEKALGLKSSVVGRESSAKAVSQDARLTTQDSSKIIIKTSKTDDQYGRYLADIWMNGKNIDQKLLDTALFTVRGDVV